MSLNEYINQLWCVRRPEPLARELRDAHVETGSIYLSQAYKAWNTHEYKDLSKDNGSANTWMMLNTAIALLHLHSADEQRAIDGETLMTHIGIFYQLTQRDPKIELGSFYPEYQHYFNHNPLPATTNDTTESQPATNDSSF